MEMNRVPRISFSQAIAISIIWAAVVGFLPPSIAKFRNPPPADLVFTWWLRFGLALGLLIFNLYMLYTYRRTKSYDRFILYISCGVAILFGAGIFRWVFEYPILFGLSRSVKVWWSH
jgi:hypothetical protein